MINNNKNFLTGSLSFNQDYDYIIQDEDSQTSIHSKLVFLNNAPYSRVYANYTVPNLILKILHNHGWVYKIDFKFLFNKNAANYPILDYIVQYHETDYDFIIRQCKKAGIFFSVNIINAQNKSVVLFCNDILLLHNEFEPLFFKKTDFQEYALRRAIGEPDTVRAVINIKLDQLFTLFKLGQGINISNNFFYISDLCFNSINNTNLVKTELILNNNYKSNDYIHFNMPDCTGVIISDGPDQNGCYYISPDFDEQRQANTHPVKLLTPSAGKRAGFNFPLVKNTRILITHLNGDPDNPIIQGVLPSEDHPSLITDKNPHQYKLKTPSGNYWLMDDSVNNAKIVLNSVKNNSKSEITPQGISFSTDQDICIYSGNTVKQTIQKNFNSLIKNNYNNIIQNNYSINTKRGNIHFNAGHDLTLQANQSIIIKANNGLVIQSRHINMASKVCYINTPEKIIIAYAGARISISSSGISVNAKAVNFITPVLTASPVLLEK